MFVSLALVFDLQVGKGNENKEVDDGIIARQRLDPLLEATLWPSPLCQHSD